MRDIASKASKSVNKLKVEKVPFRQVPHQSKLFLNYLQKPLELQHLYPSAVNTIVELQQRVPEVLAKYTTSRDELADALLEANKSWGAAPQTLKNIERLREKDCVAVVTGQQAGLFSGALYTIYKAFSVVKAAEKLSELGVNAVPIFWIASEDHDFAEVAETFVLNREGKLSEIKISNASKSEGLPVGKIAFDESIKIATKTLFDELPHTEFSGELQNLIHQSYTPNYFLGDAFAQLMSHLFSKFGLVLLDPLNNKLKKLAAPIYQRAVDRSAEITDALTARSLELETAGYHAQILVDENSFPLFLIDNDGKRVSLERQGQRVKGKKQKEKIEFSIAELSEIARNEPNRLSPNATLRAAVQDYLLPTLCYFGGAAEIAYFAQIAEVYRVLERPTTPIFHRASVTIVDPNISRTLENYNLSLPDFFERPEVLERKIVEKFLNNDTARIFADVEEAINMQLSRLDESLFPIEPTLSESLGKRRNKILYHIGALRNKFDKAEMRRHEIVERRFEIAFASLYPQKGLQERTLNVTSILARHGENVLDWIYDAIDVDAKEHQILFL